MRLKIQKMSRIRVKILEPITLLYGTYYLDDNNKFTKWKYCVKIEGQWYFEMYQSFEDINKDV